MATRDVVFLTNLENAVDGVGHHGVFVVPGVAKFLAQVSLADQDHADAGHRLQDTGEIIDRTHLFTLNDRQDFTLGRKGPDVGPGIILLLWEPPVPRCTNRGIATDAGGAYMGDVGRRG
jgi:hypothetical protein